MATWKCSQCGEEKKGQCRPKECPKCGAPRDSFVKKEEKQE